MFVGLNYVYKLKLWKSINFEIEFVYLYGYRNWLFPMLNKVELMLCCLQITKLLNIKSMSKNKLVVK